MKREFARMCVQNTITVDYIADGVSKVEYRELRREPANPSPVTRGRLFKVEKVDRGHTAFAELGLTNVEPVIYRFSECTISNRNRAARLQRAAVSSVLLEE